MCATDKHRGIDTDTDTAKNTHTHTATDTDRHGLKPSSSLGLFLGFQE